METTLLLALFSLTEILLLGVVIFFFVRLRRSEELLTKVQAGQERFMHKLQFNAQLEQEIVESFEKRQRELLELDERLEKRAAVLEKLIKQAEQFTNSPQFLRQTILAGHREGRSRAELARAAGLSLDEVDLILDQG